MSAPPNALPVEETTLLALQAYLDGELPEADREALEARIAEDPTVAEALAALAEGSALVREALERHPVPADLASSIVTFVERATVPPPSNVRPLARLRRFAPVAAALALPAAAAVFFVARANPEAPHALELPQVESAPSMQAVLTAPEDMPEGDESAPLNEGEGVDLDEVEATAPSFTVFTLPAVAARVHGTSVVVWMDDDDDEAQDNGAENAVEGSQASPRTP
jgi:anti-sigma factor RsiW